MLDFLASVWSRVYALFTWIWDNLYEIAARNYPTIAEYINTLRSYVINLVYRGASILSWYIGAFYATAYTYYKEYKDKISSFIKNDLPVLRSFIDYNLGVLLNFSKGVILHVQHIFTYYYDQIVDLIYVRYSWLSYLLDNAPTVIKHYIKDLASKLDDFITHHYQDVISFISAFNSGIGTFWQLSGDVLRWLTDPNTIRDIRNTIAAIPNLPTIIISDALLKPLNMWLTKLWYPHVPIDGEK